MTLQLDALVKIFLFSLAALGTVSCVVIPMPTASRGEIPPHQREALKVGETTRAEVVMLYGVPELRLDGDRVLVYRWNRERAAIVSVVNPLGAYIPITDAEALFLEFRGDGKLSRVGTSTAWQSRTIGEQAQAWARGDGSLGKEPAAGPSNR
jgi:hypothetical protein